MGIFNPWDLTGPCRRLMKAEALENRLQVLADPFTLSMTVGDILTRVRHQIGKKNPLGYHGVRTHDV